jgi:hypothetical protein
MFTLTLTYANGSTFIVGGFSTQAAAEAWVTTEQAKPYWISTTTSSIVQTVMNTTISGV